MAQHHTIHMGSHADPTEVKLLQEALKARGYYQGPINGIFDHQTEKAVLHYQTDRTTDPTPPALSPPPHPLALNIPLHVDGVVGPHTWSRLEPPAIKEGSQEHVFVRLCQGLLKATKNPAFDPGPTDGIFGPHTKAAVMAFQKAHGLNSDGIVGPKTWIALHS